MGVLDYSEVLAINPPQLSIKGSPNVFTIY